MDRGRFEQLVEEALAALPEQFRARLRNIAIVIQPCPPRSRRAGKSAQTGRLVLGLFQGVPLTQKSVFATAPPDRIVLYQENIEAVCHSDEEIKEQVRLTVLHEVGHYFGLNEEQLKDI